MPGVGVPGMFMLVPVTVYEVALEYSTTFMISVISVRDVVSEVTVPVVKLGTTLAAWTGDDRRSSISSLVIGIQKARLSADQSQ